jgi:hypothetical protein
VSPRIVNIQQMAADEAGTVTGPSGCTKAISETERRSLSVRHG